MTELEKRAMRENKTIVERATTVTSTEEFEALKAEIEAKGGEVIHTSQVNAKDARFTIQYRVLQD